MEACVNLMRGTPAEYPRISQKQGNVSFCTYFAASELTELSRSSDGDNKIAHLEAAPKERLADRK